MDDIYLNDFHREYEERLRKKAESRQSICYSHEFLKAQSERMNALVAKEEERLRNERKKS